MEYKNSGKTYTGTRVYIATELQFYVSKPVWAGTFRGNVNMPETTTSAANQNCQWVSPLDNGYAGD